MLCIAVCNSLTISKSKNHRQGRAPGALCGQPGQAACDANERCEDNVNSPFLGQCVCNDNFSPRGNPRQCGPALGAAGLCTPDDPATQNVNEDNCDTDNGQECNPNVNGDQPANTCQCVAATHRPNAAGDGCGRIRGTQCNDAGNPDQDICSELPNMVCSTANLRCDCANNFRRQPAVVDGPAEDQGLCAPAFGAPCVMDDDPDTLWSENCPFPGQRCLNGVCACQLNFEQDANDVCVPSIGANCDDIADNNVNTCRLPNQACLVTIVNGLTIDPPVVAGADANIPNTQFCGCNVAQEFQLQNNECVAGTGGNCEENGDADCLDGMRCYSPLPDDDNDPNTVFPNFGDTMPNGGANTGSICSCPFGEEQQGTVCVRSLGTGCNDGGLRDGDCDLDNSQCTNDVCACRANFVDDNGAVAGGACSRLIGGPCPNGRPDCTLPMSMCTDANGNEVADGAAGQNVPDAVCRCEDDFGPTADNMACRASVGAQCQTNNDCTLDNQRCVANECECDENFEQNNGACVEGIGAPCTTGNECVLPGQACDRDPTNPRCVPTVGGACPGGRVDCPLENQICIDPVDNNEVAAGNAGAGVANAVCRCQDGWQQDDGDDGACSEIDFDFCNNPDEPCGINQGDCDNDAQCQGALLCGINNCGQDRELADCCFDPAAVGVCDGNNDNFWACCQPGPNPSDDNQAAILNDGTCATGQGDCDSHNDCATGLACIPDSCLDQTFNDIFPRGQGDCCGAPTSFFYQMSNLMVSMGFDARKEDFQNEEEPEQ